MALTPTVTGMTTADQKPKDPNLNQDAGKELSGLLSKDNPLMLQARTQGLQTAASRGLLSSSMAAGASEGAMIAAAAPLAQQNAQQNAQRNQSFQDFNQTGALQQQDIASRKELSDNELAAAQQRQAVDISAQKQLQATDLTSSSERQAAQITSDATERQLDRGLQQQLASWNLDASEQGNATVMLNSAQANYSAQFQGIMANTNMSADQREAQVLLARRELANRIAVTETFFGIDIQWEPIAAADPAAAAAAAAANPAAPNAPNAPNGEGNAAAGSSVGGSYGDSSYDGNFSP
jgi:hypothetical protein